MLLTNLTSYLFPYLIIIVFYTSACSKIDKKEYSNSNVKITDSLSVIDNYSSNLATNTPKDTINNYLSKIDLSNCESITTFLQQLYIRDQLYRDSVQFYWHKDETKSLYFTKKMKEIDGINIQIIKATIQSILQKKECIKKQIDINALWLVAHHSNNNELMQAVQPAVDYAFDNKIIDEDAYKLYYKKINDLELKTL